MTEVGVSDDSIALAVAGDDLAFARIVVAHHAEMMRICHMVARDRSIAEEAAQAAWSIAWRKLGTVRQPDRLRPWLITVAVNEARKLLKKRNRQDRVELIGEQSERPGGLDPATGIAYLDLEHALERLQPVGAASDRGGLVHQRHHVRGRLVPGWIAHRVQAVA